ncbi:MAG: DUF192 domain-containing protein [Candidatus Jorgensenbacteria bacterium]|nr:DUF192 domain-containing protein [Candidatus Jorgensenbacteria bacterium]
MKAKNLTRNMVLHENVRIARTLGEKSKGLLTSVADSALFFRTRWGIHTFGMKFPIDCLVMNDDMKIVALRTNFEPRRFFFWNPRYRNVLELPAGALARTDTEVGDTVELI